MRREYQALISLIATLNGASPRRSPRLGARGASSAVTTRPSTTSSGPPTSAVRPWIWHRTSRRVPYGLLRLVGEALRRAEGTEDADDLFARADNLARKFPDLDAPANPDWPQAYILRFRNEERDAVSTRPMASGNDCSRLTHGFAEFILAHYVSRFA